MTRPHINADISELTALYVSNRDSLSFLEQLFEELVKRRTKAARTLLAQVSARLAELQTSDDLGDVESSGPPPQNLPDSGSQELFPDEVEFLGPHPDDQRKPKKLTLIRPPGTAGLPDAWQSSLKSEISLDIDDDTDLPDRFVAALRALVLEMKKNNSGAKRYALDKGARIDSTGDEHIYVFAFSDDADLFEEAQVELEIAGQRVEAFIVSISAGQLFLALKENVGEEIARAVLLIDATALIEALAEKIEQVKNGELTLNRELADAVAGSVAPPKAPSRIPGDPSTLNLNREQQNAYFRALEASVTWIMGPPGCGKTMTLGQIVRAAFEGKRRVLVCSNTNKAVDQLLYRVCHSLGTEHDAMENGQVVRLGRIADDRLRDEYAQYVTVDGIVERRSRELNRRRVDIDVQIARIDSRTKRAREIAARFDDLDRAERLVADQGQRVNEIARQQKRAEADIAANDDRLRALEVELSARKNAVFGLFKRNEAAIERDLRTCAARQSEFAKGSVNLADTYESAREKYGVAVADRDRLRRELASEDRQKAISLVKFGEDERGAFVSELREIETKISALKK